MTRRLSRRMTWFLVAAIGVLVGLLAAGLLYAWWSRRRLRSTPGVFPCRLRAAGPAAKPGWPRRKRYGCWAHDVFLVYRGPTLTRCQALAVANVTGPVPTEAGAVRGLGERPLLLRLHLDEGDVVDLVARHEDRTPATGPFVAASMM